MAQAQMINLGGTSSPESYEKQQAINRQQQLAQLLMQQGTQQPTGQMVSGRYVAPSFFQYAAPLFQMYAGKSLAKEGDKAMADLLREQSQRQQKIGTEFFESISPSQQVEMAGPYGKGVGPDGRDIPMPIAGVPDFKNALALAADPNAPAYVKNYVNEMLKPRTFKEGETFQMPSFAGGQVSFNQMGGGLPKVSPELRDAAREAKVDIRNIDNWTPQDWQKVRNIEARVNAQKQQIINIPNFAEKTFAGELAGNQAKRFDTLQSTAEKAPDTLRTVQQNRAILQSGKFFSGSPANVQLELAKMADAFGLGGTDTKTKAANSQTLITNAASATLDSISGSGLGAGQGFTDKDLKFLQDAKSFRITMTDENIRRILDLQERAARQSVARYNDRLKTLPQSSVQTMGLRPIELPMQNVRDQADAILNQSNQQSNQNR